MEGLDPGTYYRYPPKSWGQALQCETNALTTMQVDAGGTVEDEMQAESQGLLADFVNYIKEKKLVPLEDLAADFKLRTQEVRETLCCTLRRGSNFPTLDQVISRVQALEEMGRITGVMDDRGKFIYISEEEMQNVAQYIRDKGKQGNLQILHIRHLSEYIASF